MKGIEATMIKVPTTGEKITYKDNQLVVPNNPIIPFIEGDGIGVDITPVMKDVVDAAVAKAYGGEKEISWMEIFCGEKSVEVYGCLLYTSPSPRDKRQSRMPSSA